jgi:hypothetical protein
MTTRSEDSETYVLHGDEVEPKLAHAHLAPDSETDFGGPEGPPKPVATAGGGASYRATTAVDSAEYALVPMALMAATLNR